MTWALIFATVAVGFGEYCCAHYFLQKIFKLTDNKTHLILAILILTILSLPMKILSTAFMITLFFTPLVIWLGIKFSGIGK